MSGAVRLLPQYAFMAWCSFKKKHRDNFISTFITTNFGRMRHIFHIFSSHLLLKVLERTHDAYFLLNASVCVCVCVCRERERERLVGIIKLIIMQCISCRNFADKKEFFNLTF